MDTPYQAPTGLLSWLDIVSAAPGAVLSQVPPGRHRATGHDDYNLNPRVDAFTLDQPWRWTRLDGDADVAVEGRLIGGHIETLCNAAGTPYGDVATFARHAAPEGLLVYVEAWCDAFAVCRRLHGMRLAGFFAAANAVLDSLGCLGVPIIADVECGHVPPYMPIVNGVSFPPFAGQGGCGVRVPRVVAG